MPRNRVKPTAANVSSHSPDCRLIEFYDPVLGRGGMLAIRRDLVEGKLYVSVFDADDGVVVGKYTRFDGNGRRRHGST